MLHRFLAVDSRHRLSDEQRDAALACCIAAVGAKREHVSPTSWTASLAVCHAAFDASIDRHPRRPYPEDVAAAMYPVFADQGMWQHALSFHFGVESAMISRAQQNLTASPSATALSSLAASAATLNPSSSVSAVLRALWVCGKRSDDAVFCRLFDESVDRIPSGHVPGFVSQLRAAGDLERAANLAAVYIARGGDLSKMRSLFFSHSSSSTTTLSSTASSKTGDVQQQQQGKEDVSATKSRRDDPRFWEGQLRSASRSARHGNNAVAEFVTKTLRPQLRVADGRLLRVLHSTLVFNDEVTLCGQVRTSSDRAAAGFELWSRALKVAAQIASMSMQHRPEEGKRADDRETVHVGSNNSDLASREVIALAALDDAAFFWDRRNSNQQMDRHPIRHVVEMLAAAKPPSVSAAGRQTSSNDLRAFLCWLRCRNLAERILLHSAIRSNRQCIDEAAQLARRTRAECQHYSHQLQQQQQHHHTSSGGIPQMQELRETELLSAERKRQLDTLAQNYCWSRAAAEFLVGRGEHSSASAVANTSSVWSAALRFYARVSSSASGDGDTRITTSRRVLAAALMKRLALKNGDVNLDSQDAQAWGLLSEIQSRGI